MKKSKEQKLRKLIRKASSNSPVSEALKTAAGSGKKVGSSASRRSTSRNTSPLSPDLASTTQYVSQVPRGTRTAFPVGDTSGRGRRARITSRAGYRDRMSTSRGTAGGGEHGAYDFGVPVGTPIVAFADGEIVRTGSGGDGGNSVTIRHGFNMSDGRGGSGVANTYYAHLSRIDKTSGSVRAGEVIGLSGATGNVTGPHLHWSIYVNGERVKDNAVYDSALSGATVITQFSTPGEETSDDSSRSGLAESTISEKAKSLLESRISLSSFVNRDKSNSDLENIIDRIVREEMVKEAIKTSAGKKIQGTSAAASSSDNDSDSPTSASGPAAQIARAEVEAWGGKDESDPSMSDKLTAYWRNAAAPDYQDDQPWSAAFVSWAKQNEPDFQKSAAHATYMRDAKSNRDSGKEQGQVAFQPSETQPEPGDVVCKPREGDGDGWENIGSKNHCDVYLGGGKMAGGNLGDTAKIVNYSPQNATMIIKKLAESFDLSEEEILEVEDILRQA
mgnify:CR=1 FL=1